MKTEPNALRAAFAKRPKPDKWVRDDLHPMDRMDGDYFVQHMKAGEDLALLFQSAIPYFALLTDEARLFLFPDYLATLFEDECHIFGVLAHFQGEHGKVLARLFTPAEREATLQFIDAFSKLERSKFYQEDFRELMDLISSSQN
jgi:hypothetical protein